MFLNRSHLLKSASLPTWRQTVLVTARCLSKYSSLPREKEIKRSELNLRTMKPPSGTQDSSRYLRRTFAPKYQRSRSLIEDELEHVLTSALTVKPCTTVSTGERYDFEKCIQLLYSKGLRAVSLIPDEIISFRYQANGYRGDVMILIQNGTIVNWGFDETFVSQNILHLVEDARINPLPHESFETEDMDFVEVESVEQYETIQASVLQTSDIATTLAKYAGTSFLAGDLIVINSIDSDSGMLDKAAFSSGLARSTNLAVLEKALEAHISQTRIITEKISKGVKLKLGEGEALKLIGKLFLIRGKLNLYSELIETPDLYWSEPQLERTFKETSKYLDIGPRISILNSKLDYSTDECRALMSVLSERKSTFLEWIIIYLITLEIVFELYHFYERYYLDNPKFTKKDNTVL
ncbi:hypothetical protein HG537_0E03490 [Torulaspora globosa]|uniref:DUF155 domain-containing protein n=1 Tax=Torulaspora globosa TaxID=48254 RepID=A0A7H9HTD7_9SACH|nr:hypothetical protein HG537_0E03490 [Torulaspora sp. CBS 2947]